MSTTSNFTRKVPEGQNVFVWARPVEAGGSTILRTDVIDLTGKLRVWEDRGEPFRSGDSIYSLDGLARNDYFFTALQVGEGWRQDETGFSFGGRGDGAGNPPYAVVPYDNAPLTPVSRTYAGVSWTDMTNTLTFPYAIADEIYDYLNTTEALLTVTSGTNFDAMMYAGVAQTITTISSNTSLVIPDVGDGGGDGNDWVVTLTTRASAGAHFIGGRSYLIEYTWDLTDTVQGKLVIDEYVEITPRNTT